MLKPYAFDLPSEVAKEIIPQFRQAGFYFEHIDIDESITLFAVFAYSDREAFAIFTLALSTARRLA